MNGILCNIIFLIIIQNSLIYSKTVSSDESGIIHTDEWAVQLNGDINQAHEYAKLHGFELIGTVSFF